MREAIAPRSRSEVSRRLIRLLTSTAPILVGTIPVAILGQVVVNSARVAAPSGAFETTTANNEAIDNDTLITQIAANSDSAGPVNGATGGNDLIGVFANDNLNGTPVDPAAINATVVSPATPINGGKVPVLDTATGKVSVPAGTPAGTYVIDYRICETANPENCATSDVSIEVTASPIAASADSITGITVGVGSANAGNVLANDTLNLQAPPPSGVLLTVTAPAIDPGITLDPTTGNVSVAPTVPVGSYVIGYKICEALNPNNCAEAAVTITVEAATSSVTGTVYDDRNGNRALDPGENRRAGWIVEILQGETILATKITDAQGNYRFDGLPSGGGYSVRFINPENMVVYGVIADLTLANNAVVIDQNLPLDPSGVIYNSVSRVPIANAIVSLLGANGSPLPSNCFISPTQQGQRTDGSGYYRFDLIPGAAPLCPTAETVYTIAVTPPSGLSAPSTVLPGQPGIFDPTGMAGPVMIGTSSSAPAPGDPVRWYQSLRLAPGDPDVIFNNIPLDPFISRPPLVVAKTSLKRSASVGEIIPYTITVHNTEGLQRGSVDVIDILPPGFKYVTGTASIDGIAAEPRVSDRELRWSRQMIPANATVTYKLTAVVGAGVMAGDRVNNGLARNSLDNSDISNRGQAVISIVPSAVFDCSEVIGKVFEDVDGDGYQDNGEPGIPGARLATVNGELIATDEFGRYHIACAAVPDAQIGSNFLLKLDLRTVAQGFWPTADNPQSIRLTRGKVSELNFGVQRAKTLIFDIDSRAFVGGSTALRPEFARKLASLKPDEAVRLVIQINYRAQPGESWPMAEERLAGLKKATLGLFSNDWKTPAPVIEANISRVFGGTEQGASK